MPFIPHTPEDIREMLDAIGVDDTETLFDEIPAGLRIGPMDSIPLMASEMAVSRIMHERAERDGAALNFIGAGAYEHHIPAAVWEITTRGEFYSAYTPYQAEASQGTLQLIYEYQTMMAALTGQEVANASLYDGASAVAEASLMAVRANRKSKSKHILVAGTLNPRYLQVAKNITQGQGLEFTSLPFDEAAGVTVPDVLTQFDGEDIAAVVIAQPNFFGMLESVDQITDWAHNNGALVVAVVNPTSLAVFEAPGNWGETGADIVCGEGQPLGVPLSAGGPYFGFMTTRLKHVRQMPGRIVGRTVDLDGKTGYSLTLQAREQHIRRSRATSNICTNQGLLVTAATIYMSMLGAEGLARVAQTCMQRTNELVDALGSIDGVSLMFEGARFHEAVMQLDRPVAPVLDKLAGQNIFAGYDLAEDYPDLGPALLVCATETKNPDDIETCARAFQEAMDQAQVA
ncbi:MAG: aminomethyl-transferring glycine dehydrogenase subunit GcvPA [Gammaproteobacteria bacterium]|nr:aminomethyl-transferring glycine dehydrogenase subunit GcvPA [Gammaproteobacteria bacterium]